MDCILNKTKDKVLAGQAKVADNFFFRLAGLMFRRGLVKEQALIFYRTNSIHTCFMRFDLDVLFVSRDLRVVRLIKRLKPWRMVFCRSAYAVIEFSADNNNLAETESGDQLALIPAPVHPGGGKE